MRNKVTRRISSICLVFCMFLAAIFSDGSLSDIFSEMIGVSAVFADTGDSSDDDSASDADDASEDSDTASADTGTDDILGKITVYNGGEAVTAASFRVSESVTLTAEYNGEGGNYSWQIYDSSQTTWFDISGQTATEIRVGYAMVANMLDEKDAAYVRCKVTDGDLLYYSDVITLCVDTETSTSNSSNNFGTTSVSSNSGTESNSDSSGVISVSNDTGAEEEEDLDEVTVCANDLPKVTSSGFTIYTIEVEYVYYIGSTAYSSYTANVIAGADLSTTVTSPTIVGYTPYYSTSIVDTTTTPTGSTPIYSYTDSSDVVHYVYGTEAASVTLDYSDISADDTVTIVYYPSIVNYTVLHYVQNIVNDDYVLYYTESASGYVGATIEITDLTDPNSGDAEMSCGGYICVSGNDSTTIAADGSTMIYVYYDRVYYVMSFDLSGGSGVSPIYAKYGTPVSISDPVRTGYDFAYWYDESNASLTYTSVQFAATITTIPAENTRYVAVWTAAKTTYTVVYWRENANDDDYSYWCQMTVTATTGATIDVSSIQGQYYTDSISSITGTSGPVFSQDVSTTQNQYFLGAYDGRMVKSITDYTDTGTVSDYSAIPIFSVTAVDGVSDAYYISYESDGVTYYLQFTAFDNFDTRAYPTVTTDLSEATAWYYKATASGDNGLYCTNSGTNYYLAVEYTYGFTVKTAPSKVYLYGVNATWESEYFTYDADTTESYYTTTVEVAADGSTVVNIYYSRNVYKLRFFFARKYDNQWYIATGTGDGWFFQVFDDETDNTNNIEEAAGTCGVESLTIDDTDESKTPYANLSGETVDSVLPGTYYYAVLEAKYNADISDQWPLAVLGTSDSNKTDQNMILDTLESNKDEYLFISWGTQENSTYWKAHSNKNIKGPYGTMSAELIQNTNSSGSYITYSETTNGGSAHDLMAYYAMDPNIYVYEIYLQNTDGTYNATATYSNEERATSYGNGQNAYSYVGFTLVTGTVTIEEKDDNGIITSEDITADSGGRVYTDNSGSGVAGGTIKFYYSRNQYTLSLYNINTYISSNQVYYNAALDSYLIDETTMESTYYSSTLVEGVYEFGGWYTTADCLDGTAVTSSSVMPASNLVLYAKWVPKTYDVEVYQTSNLTHYVYDNNGQLKWLTENDEGLDYGASLPGAVQESGPDQTISENSSSGTGEIEPDWIFVCWAYQKDGVEYALDVSSFTVFGDVQIYAKWTSNTLLSYEITYMIADLYVDYSGNIYDNENLDHLLTFDSSGNLCYDDGTVYTVTSTGVSVADATTGYLYEGANRTFTAKTGTGLYTDYQSEYYPLTSSHSVLMVDEDNDGVVTYTFYYIKTSPVKYSVYFVDANGNSMFDVATHSYTDEQKSSYKGIETSSSVVTENYLYFSGYTVDAVQKTLVLSANEAENVITFVYSKSDTAPYTVNYYYEVLSSADGYDLEVIDGNGVTRYYRLYTTESGTVDVGDTFTVHTDWAISGYEYEYHDVYQYSLNNTSGMVEVGIATTYTGGSGTEVKVESEYGTLANVFYNLLSYPYIVYHLYLDGSNVIDPEKGTATYTSEVTAKALTDAELNAEGIYGYTVDSSNKTATITIEVDNGSTPTVNVINFIYYEDTVTYQYQTMLLNSSGAVTELNDKNAAAVSVESQNVEVDTGTASTSVAYYDSQIYEFVGWYLDVGCTIQLTTGGIPDSSSNPTTYTTYDYASVESTNFTVNGSTAATEQLTPLKTQVGTSAVYIYQTDTSLNTTVNTESLQVFYALFRLKQGSLTIYRTNQDQEHYNSANSFTYTVTQLTDASGATVSGSDAIVMTVTIDPGEESVTIYNLPAGTYEVTQDNDWSWRYNDDSFLVDGGTIEVTSVEIVSGEATSVTFNNSYDRYWLSGFSNALTNVYGNTGNQ